MRQGHNPQKRNESSTQPPEAITVAVLIYIPEEKGYYEKAFDTFRLCLASIRENADQPFDLLVLDNGSCDKVRTYLKQELSEGRIDILISNFRNVGKLNAVFQMLWSAPGEYVFFTDGDIYYKPGWMNAHLDIINTYPKVGIVGGVPLRNQAHDFTKGTIQWVEENKLELLVEDGDIIPEAWTREYLRSVDQEQFIDTWINFGDRKITYKGVTAFVGASHMQYLIRREVLESIKRFRSDKTISKDNDLVIDDYLESNGYLRLSAEKPYVYHIGNSLSEAWLVDEFVRLVQEVPVLNKNSSKAQKYHWLWSRWKVRLVVMGIYEWAFKLLYEYK